MFAKILEFLRDERGVFSSTRLVGILAGLTLCGMGLAQAFSPLVVDVSESLVDALSTICVGALLGAQIGKFAKPPTEPSGE